MAFRYSPKIVTDGLVLATDPANHKSYIGSGTNLNSTIGDEVGTLTNNPSFNTREAGGTITLDGSNDFVTFGNAPVANFDHDDSFTYEIWMRSTANASKYIMGKNESSGNYRGVEITYRGNAHIGKIAVAIRNTNATSNRLVVSTENATYRGNNWHHLVVTYDGSGNASGIDIIIDTVSDLDDPISTGNISGGITSTSNLCIGSRNGAANYLPGTFGAFKIYNKVLTSAEILQNYNALKNRFI